MEIGLEKNDIIAGLTKLVQGQISPANWVSWWNHNLATLERELPRTAFLKIKPNVAFGETRAALISQTGAFDFLTKQGVAVTRSDVYSKEWNDENEQSEAGQSAQDTAAREAFRKHFPTLQTHFPKLHKALSKYLSADDKVDSGVSLADIATKEQALGLRLTEAQKAFFTSASALYLDGVQLNFSRIRKEFLNDKEYLYLGEYWLESDGDTIWCELDTADAAVYYLSHSAKPARVKLLSTSFQKFIEKELVSFIKDTND